MLEVEVEIVITQAIIQIACLHSRLHYLQSACNTHRYPDWQPALPLTGHCGSQRATAQEAQVGTQEILTRCRKNKTQTS